MAIFTFFCFTGEDSLLMCWNVFLFRRYHRMCKNRCCVIDTAEYKIFFSNLSKFFYIDIRNFSKKLLNVEIFTNVFFKPNEVARKLIQIIN